MGNHDLMERQLADCSCNPVGASFLCPEGEVFDLLLGIPEESRGTFFAGHLYVKDGESGEILCDSAFTSASTEQGNWLEHRNLACYILTLNNKQWDKIKPGRAYDVTIDFSQNPPSDASLWLHWVY